MGVTFSNAYVQTYVITYADRGDRIEGQIHKRARDVESRGH
jgi:hypothetical protein